MGTCDRPGRCQPSPLRKKIKVRLYTTGGVSVVYTNVYVHHRRSFAAHTSGGPENSWSMPAWAINWAIMEAVVEPKRSSILRGMGRSKILGDM